MWHPVARQGSFLQEVICHSVWVFEEGWIPSCQLTAFRMGDEANQISCGRLQADSVQGSGNDLSSRASRAWCARCAAGLCAVLASCSPRLRAGAKAPCRQPGARGRAAAAWRQLWGSPGFPVPHGDAVTQLLQHARGWCRAAFPWSTLPAPQKADPEPGQRRLEKQGPEVALQRS